MVWAWLPERSRRRPRVTFTPTVRGSGGESSSGEVAAQLRDVFRGGGGPRGGSQVGLDVRHGRCGRSATWVIAEGTATGRVGLHCYVDLGPWPRGDEVPARVVGGVSGNGCLCFLEDTPVELVVIPASLGDFPDVVTAGFALAEPIGWAGGSSVFVVGAEWGEVPFVVVVFVGWHELTEFASEGRCLALR
jgi:hypothetical protein